MITRGYDGKGFRQNFVITQLLNGHGQQCYSELTGTLADFDAFRVELTRDYDVKGFREDFLVTLVQTAVANRATRSLPES